MSRRSFLRGSLGALAAAVATPVIARAGVHTPKDVDVPFPGMSSSEIADHITNALATETPFVIQDGVTRMDGSFINSHTVKVKVDQQGRPWMAGIGLGDAL
ncbi:twin-arginine translocation signal domain-containing protein [Paenalcaligenes niemegkensis]|uniref:twin-arginine translocation signal domain-containing protein n=1 Tax=Paenalcaligenes niemegkensis TaxID=2895469 RepID=UPI001EE9616A|nr:twin-arginine translocation signal domain-containing protein [Paenalcaligenes niemegkensis]MCQ9615928.1 twin-arginine translocation signal domain-containing protein [Paenalcaligenes niemegkensis]